MDHLSDKKTRAAPLAIPSPATSATPTAQASAAIQWSVCGGVEDTDRGQADAAISDVLAQFRRVVGHARIRISGANRSGGPGLIQVNLRVCGAPARIQVAARSMPTAIVVAGTRLRHQLTRLTSHWQPMPWPDPQRRPLAIPGEAPISRLKSFRLHTGMPCQAAAFLNAMDYDVFLYTDAETGEDAIVYRAGPTGLSLARQKTMHLPAMPTLLPLTVNPRRTPILTPAQAAARLAGGWLPFLFYTDHRTRRGNLLYRRYDGNLGLIAPTDPLP